jgi:lipoprotein NlpI
MEYQAALDAYDAALDADPKSYEALSRRSVALLELHRYDELGVL